jgi:hypothetical protein
MTDFTKTIEEIRNAYAKLIDPTGLGGYGIHEAVETHMAKIADLKAEVDASWREKIEGKKVDTDDSTLEANKDIADFAKRCGYNQCIDDLIK